MLTYININIVMHTNYLIELSIFTINIIKFIINIENKLNKTH